MRPLGYLLNVRTGLVGEPGVFYDYILAGNGVFIQARGPLLEARIAIADVIVRGLPPLEEKLSLPKARIPRRLYDLAISTLAVYPERESYLAITWEGEYRLRRPWQEGDSGGVRYEVLPNTILDIHSHGTMPQFFSGIDTRDEQGLKLYAVVGRLDTLIPEVEVRVGVYGYFAPIEFDEVFYV